ncbi:MAG: hypothetical protein Tsb0026_01140 [Sulfuricaulis sp.]
MKKGLVSIMMPVMNGELFLEEALKSLLAQDYSNFELVILDNMSTDRTPLICREFAGRDKRIRYVLDETNRITHDAANHLAGFITGEYCMVACDDDLWASNFLSRLVNHLDENKGIGLVYSNGLYVDVNNRVGTKTFLSGRQIYLSYYSCFSNFWNYLGTRRVVPILFGLYRSETYIRALPFDTFDETIADVDNLFMLKILAETRVHCINENLFFYRNKFRWADPDLLPSYPKDRNLIKVWFYDFRHQALFTRKIVDVIRSSGFTKNQKVVLKVRAQQCLFLHMTLRRFRSWIGNWLIRLGLRHGVTQQRDVSAEIRHHALLEKVSTSKIDSP